VRGFLGKGSLGAERPKHFIRRHVQEPEPALRAIIEGRPVATRFLQQGECSYDIRANEFGRAIDRTVDVRLGGKMDDSTEPMAFEYPSDGGRIADVDSLEAVSVIVSNLGDGIGVPRVRQLVDVDHDLGRVRDQLTDYGGADEPRTSRNYNGHVRLCSWSG